MPEPSSVRYVLKSLEFVPSDADPLSAVAHQPKHDDAYAAAPLRPAAAAVHAVWETYGNGRAPTFSLPEGLPLGLGGKAVLEQKELFISGQDVFRIDAAGRVLRHESAWDQSLEVGRCRLTPC